MDVTKQPYELLIRWDQDGNIVGAHVQWRYVIRDPAQPGKIVGETVTHAEPVSLDGKGADFPLADILDQATIDALAKVNQADARVAEVEERLEEAEVKVRDLEQELASEQARVDKLAAA